MRRYCKEVDGPKMANMVEQGDTPYLLEDELGEMGYKIAILTLNEGRIGIGAQMIGLAQGAFDNAMRYILEREQFGKRIADFQGIQFLLSDMATDLALCETLLWHVGRMVDNGAEDFSIEASMLKMRAGDVAMRITTDAVQLYG